MVWDQSLTLWLSWRRRVAGNNFVTKWCLTVGVVTSLRAFPLLLQESQSYWFYTTFIVLLAGESRPFKTTHMENASQLVCRTRTGIQGPKKEAKSKICLFFWAGVKIHTSTHVAELFPDKDEEVERPGPGRGLVGVCMCVCVWAPGPSVLDSDGLWESAEVWSDTSAARPGHIKSDTAEPSSSHSLELLP